MAFRALTNIARFSGPTSDRTAQLEECAIGDEWFDDDLFIWYKKTNAGAWVAIGTSPGPVGSLPSIGYSVATTITRPANQTPYTAGDVVGGALDLGVLGPSAGIIELVSSMLELDISAIPAGMTSFILYLYNVTPPSAVADNGVWDLPSGDRASYLGALPIGTPADLVSTCFVEVNDFHKLVQLLGTHLFGYLVTVGGFTPAANSEVYKLTLASKAAVQ